MAIIVPAILESDPDAFQDKLESIIKIPNLEKIHIDISDGKFTPNQTISIESIPVLNPAYRFEAHLMVENPGNYFLDAQIAGFNDVVFHFEACPDKSMLSKLSKQLKDMKIQAGLGVSPETPLESVLPYVALFDYVLLLGVKPGFQGQEFETSVISKTKSLRDQEIAAKITVDGGIKASNARALMHAGADFLVVGSALFQNLDQHTPAYNFEMLESEIKNL
jgi:ribulose-phosphate 3-epimerase